MNETPYTQMVGIMLLMLAMLIALAFQNKYWGEWVFQSAALLDGRATTTAFVSSPFIYTFNTNEILHEAQAMEKSSSPYFWLDSGGIMYFQNGIGSTAQGELPETSPWHNAYEKNNPVDTDGGAHPQNIFRLVTRSLWEDFTQEAYVRITVLNLSESPNRNESNGIFLFNRYADGDDLYYAGIRVDGDAVIKKKQNGVYLTLAETRIFPGGTYDRERNPDLLPENVWIGLKSLVRTEQSGEVVLDLLIDRYGSGRWELALQAIDNGLSTGPVIAKEGYAGLRTDFMDVEFRGYRLTEF